MKKDRSSRAVPLHRGSLEWLQAPDDEPEGSPRLAWVVSVVPDDLEPQAAREEDPDGMVAASLDAICFVLGSPGALILTWDELSGRFRTLDTEGPVVAALRTVLEAPTGSDLVRDAFQTSEVKRAAATDRALGRIGLAAWMRSLGLDHVVCAPLHFHGRTMGVAAFGFTGKHPPSASLLRDLPRMLVPVSATLLVLAQARSLEAEVRRRTATEMQARKANRDLVDALCELRSQRDQIKRARDVLDREVERLKELDQLKADFLNAASHELRTPLSTVKGYAEFLEDELAGPLTSEQGRFVHEIQSGAERLRRIVDDMLDFARLEAGTFKISRVEADLRPIVAGVLSSLAPQAGVARVKLQRSLPGDPVTLAFDPARIEQVLLNLVGNALKFTEPGGRVTVRIRPGKAHVRVEVRDTGIGIPAEHVPRLFQKFYQVNRSLTREHGGAGLGLAISRAIVEAHEGQIGVRSAVGRGTVFWFTLPVA